jgi:hypothetical protein
VNVIRHCCPFDQFQPLLTTQIAQYRPNTIPGFPVKHFVTVLRYENNMILAFPPDVGHALPVMHLALLRPLGPSQEESLFISSSRRNSKALSCLTARGGGLPKWNYVIGLLVAWALNRREIPFSTFLALADGLLQ